MCKSCLLLLSVPTLHREAATHASAVLVRLALASWRASGRWPSRAFFASMETAPLQAPPPAPALASPAAATGQVGACESHSSVPEQGRGATARLAAAATTISKSFFPYRRGQGAGTDDAADGTAALISGFMPLPPSSSLAVCRALLHIVHPRVLLEGLDPEEGAPEAAMVANIGPGLGRETAEGGGVGREWDHESVDFEGTAVEGGTARRGSLMLGAIFGVILRYGGASSGLSLRFLALQVRAVNVFESCCCYC